MITKNTKIILFASLIAVMILPFSMTDSVYAESRSDKIERLGNEGKNLKEKIDIEKNSVKKEKLNDDLKELKINMKAIGIPTIEEYESDKQYWRDIAVQHHLDELDRIEKDSKKNNIQNVSYTQVDCSDCDDDNQIVKFQTAYGYDCYLVWTCHAYAPVWAYLSDGETKSQTLTVGNDHNWMDPFWLIGGNQAMSVTYTYNHVNYDDGGNQVGNSPYTGGDTQYINSSSDVDSVSKSDRVEEPRSGYSVDTQWTISSVT